MRLILLGPPGAGKGTQAAGLASRWGVPHVSTGDMLRAAMDSEEAISQEAQVALSSGELVPDEIVLGLIKARFAEDDMRSGWILDGFPRTLAQAKALDELLAKMDVPQPKVVHFEVMTGLLIDRLMGMARADDTVTAIRQRLAVYKQETAPLVDYYEQRLCLMRVNASLPQGEVMAALSGLGTTESGTAPFIETGDDLSGLLAAGQLVVLDCTAAWCGPCKLLAPLMDQLAGEWREGVAVRKLDVDAHPEIAKRYGVGGVPTVLFLRGEALLESTVGVKPYAFFAQKVQQLMEA